MPVLTVYILNISIEMSHPLFAYVYFLKTFSIAQALLTAYIVPGSSFY